MAKKTTPDGKREEQAPSASPRDRIIDALMRLAAARPYDEISISALASEAGVSLAEFRDLFPSKGAIMGAFSRRIDHIVLAGIDPELDAESQRDRLFDVLMRRIDAMAPFKEGLRSIAKSLRGDPLSLAAMNQVALNSMRFMLEAAGASTEGPLGTIKLQGAVLAFARTLNTWFDDDDPGLAKTLARLDRELSRGERLLGYADDAYRLTAPLRAFGRALAEGGAELRRRRTGQHRSRAGGDVDGNGEDQSPAQAI